MTITRFFVVPNVSDDKVPGSYKTPYEQRDTFLMTIFVIFCALRHIGRTGLRTDTLGFYRKRKHCLSQTAQGPVRIRISRMAIVRIGGSFVSVEMVMRIIVV